MDPKLIVALDFNDQNKAFKLIDTLEPSSCALKIGHELFTRYGAEFVKQVIAKNFRVFLDLKFYDIPNTVAQACKVVADLGVWMINVHASGGLAMLQAAKAALEPYGKDKPLLIAVTVLTSFSEQDLLSLGISQSLLEHATKLALLAKNSGLDGVVSSAHEVRAIKQMCGNSFKVVTPGIRPDNSPKNDQVRTMIPQEAIIEGSDYLVIGRPITQAENPAEVIKQINASIIRH